MRTKKENNIEREKNVINVDDGLRHKKNIVPMFYSGDKWPEAYKDASNAMERSINQEIAIILAKQYNDLEMLKWLEEDKINIDNELKVNLIILESK